MTSLLHFLRASLLAEHRIHGELGRIERAERDTAEPGERAPPKPFDFSGLFGQDRDDRQEAGREAG